MNILENPVFWVLVMILTIASIVWIFVYSFDTKRCVSGHEQLVFDKDVNGGMSYTTIDICDCYTEIGVKK